MHWTRFALGVLVAGTAVSLSDWLFMGVLFHDRYNDHPEIWRHPHGGHEIPGVVFSIVWGFITAAVLGVLYSWLNLHTFTGTTGLALAIWLLAPVPLIVTNGMFLKFHPGVSFSHAAGWAVRLFLIAIVMTLILK